MPFICCTDHISIDYLPAVFRGAPRALYQGVFPSPRCAPLRALARGYDYVALRAMSLRDGIPLPSRGRVSCLPGKYRPPDGRIAYILPRPKGRGYRNFRRSGVSCLPGKRRHLSFSCHIFETVKSFNCFLCSNSHAFYLTTIFDTNIIIYLSMNICQVTFIQRESSWRT